METNVSKASCSLCGDNKIEGGHNTHFEIDNKMSNGKKNGFPPERVQKAEGKVFVSQHVNNSCESNYNVNLKQNNVLSADDEDLVDLEYTGQFRRNLRLTVNIFHINENSSDMNNTEPDGSANTASITSDEPSFNRATLIDEEQLSGIFCSKTVLILVIKFLQKLK